MRFLWSDDLATGNVIIDSEHKTLIKAADDLMVAISSNKTVVDLNKSMQFLANYTKKHFKHEEELQEASKYPGIVNHKIWHRKFVAGVTRLLQKIQAEGPSQLSIIGLHKAVTLLISHIRTEDSKIANHIKNQKGK